MTTLVLHNGPIYTLSPEQPVARALAIRDGRVLAVGSEGRIQAAVGGRAETINLQGRAVVPGLTDAHVHITFQGLAAQEVRLGGVMSVEGALEQIAARAAAMPEGAWVRGGGWDHANWGGRWPTRTELDRVCPDRPALLSRKDGHSAWANSKALALAGIDAATPDPSGGQIQRDPDGEPTGILLETAIGMVRAVMPEPTPAERLDALRLAFREALSYGITSIHIPPSMRPTDGQETLSDLSILRERGELSLRCLAHLWLNDLDMAIGLGVRSGLGDPWLRVGSMKLFADGSLGSESAEMLAHYEGRRHLGIAVLEQEVLEAAIVRAHAHGISSSVHAIGDAANRKVLDAMERAMRLHPEVRLPLPHRIEHCQVLHPKDIPRFGQLGIIASMQPVHCTSDIELADMLWGSRCAGAYAWRSLLETGAILAFGSDAPVESLNPWLSVHAAVNRQRPGGYPSGGWYPDQRLTIEETMRGFCVGPAIASGEQHLKGQLAPGLLADLAVLTGDPFRSAPGDLHAITAAMTFVEGKVVYERK